MRVQLAIHLEKVPGGRPAFVWWAECAELPGFSAAADHLPELLRRAHEAVPTVLAEQHLDAVDVEIAAELITDRGATGTSSALVLDTDARSPAVRTVVLTA